jgi:hypothetical protein
MIFPITPRSITLWLLLAALVAGTISDVSPKRPPLFVGGYRVLAVDFHVHSFPLSWATLSPWDTVLEAKRRGLDAIAMTPHNHVWVSKVGRWFSRLIGGPTILVGEEIVAPRFHILAVGIENTISWRQKAASAIDEVHRQGGVAIAAHPTSVYWRGYDAEAMRKLDAAEVLHPLAYDHPAEYLELQEFYGRAKLTAVGDSDYHGLRPMGLCRTFVFVRENSPSAILDALRAGHTVVYDRDARAFGDPELIRLAAQEPRFAELRSSPSNDGFLTKASRVCGLLGLLGLFFFGFGRPARTDQHASGSL